MKNKLVWWLTVALLVPCAAGVVGAPLGYWLGWTHLELVWFVCAFAGLASWGVAQTLRGRWRAIPFAWWIVWFFAGSTAALAKADTRTPEFDHMFLSVSMCFIGLVAALTTVVNGVEKPPTRR